MHMLRASFIALLLLLVPVAASAGSADQDTRLAQGKTAAQKMVGSWSLVLPAEMLTEFEAVKKAAAADPASEMMAAQLKMMEMIVEVIGSTTLTVDATKVTMSGPDPETKKATSESATYRVVEDTENQVRFEATDEKGDKDMIRMEFVGPDTMKMTDEGDAKAPTIEFKRK